MKDVLQAVMPVELGPLRITTGLREDIARDLAAGVASGRGRCIAFANTHLLYCAIQDRALAIILGHFSVFNDGIGIEFFARTIAGRGFLDNLNGTDLTPAVMQALPAEARIFLVGGIAGVADCVRERWRETYPHLQFCGAANGYDDIAAPEFRRRITEARADVIVVAMGNPLQERWIAQMSPIAPGALWMGVGALFDMVSDRHARAPMMYRRLRLEWAHRLAMEPARLWRRYTYEILAITVHLVRHRRRLAVARS